MSLVGCAVNLSLLAKAAVTSNVALVSPSRPLDVAPSVYPAPTLLMLRLLNVATPTPLTALRVSVPDSTALVSGSAASATVIALVAAVTVFPYASITLTWTDGEMDEPAATLLGCTW